MATSVVKIKALRYQNFLGSRIHFCRYFYWHEIEEKPLIWEYLHTRRTSDFRTLAHCGFLSLSVSASVSSTGIFPVCCVLHKVLALTKIWRKRDCFSFPSSHSIVSSEIRILMYLHIIVLFSSYLISYRTKPRKSTVGVLLAVGGSETTSDRMPSIERYDLRTDRWHQIFTLNSRRYGNTYKCSITHV